MAGKKKIYDVEEVVRLYKKYGTVHAVTMRMGIGAKIVKEILEEQKIEIKKYVPSRYDIKQRFEV